MHQSNHKRILKHFDTGFNTKILVATTLLLLLNTASFAQNLDKAKLDTFFNRLDEKQKAMGSLVITKDGKSIYNRMIGYSYINGTEKKQLTTATKYRVGSVTKMFTAALIFGLIEDGKLNLNDKLDQFYPQIKNAEKMTIAHILAHRSGIHDVTGDGAFRTLRTIGITKDEMLTFTSKTSADFEPDTKYAYSNTGYFILGMVVEKITGKSYEEVLKERITSRLGLKDTYAGIGDIDVNKNESFSYRFLTNWEPQPVTHSSLLFGSGSLISTPADMAKFIQELFKGNVVSKKSLDQMMALKMGMTTFTYHGKTFYGHTGGVDNFGSWLVYQPEEKVTVSYATNAKVFPVTNIIDGIFDIYYNKPFTIPAFETIAISPEVLDKYTGIYTLPDAPVKFTVIRNGSTLSIQMNDQAPILLEAMGSDKFGIESAGIIFEFDLEKNKMTQKRGGRERVFTKEK